MFITMIPRTIQWNERQEENIHQLIYDFARSDKVLTTRIPEFALFYFAPRNFSEK